MGRCFARFTLLGLVSVFGQQGYALDIIEEGSANFSGIVALGNCSGSLVRFEQSRDSDQALVFTNGHCVSLLDADSALLDQPANRSFVILTPEGEDLATVQAERLVYATMTGTDLAIYRLPETYADIRNAHQTEALTLSRTSPKPATDIEVISGYWRRGYECAIEAIIPTLKEDRWTWHDSLRYSRPGCETIGGTSGSPIIEAGTRTMIGINNTGNHDGQACTFNNPCEFDANGVQYYEKGLSYGQQTALVYDCLNEENALDLNREGCRLTKPAAH